jgi:SOS-response transcriptional repressor LexA
MHPLTPRQREVYQAIKDYWREVERSPSYQDLRTRLNINETALRRHIEILTERGYIAPRRRGIPRDIYLAKPVGEAA